ncbi:hypothetical protein EDB81DRAFT_699030 [Dactylonectria macrodidyma]|uniref:Uncharacterized protein n=1 Tax=Dactylonectria macrodidyma TaxID=307937 RepID=A0A9P9DS00_9HYPO|nr:hypothetical protein EDB81DRAFT_699030 [Dactylonectria macrodidyma]
MEDAHLDRFEGVDLAHCAVPKPDDDSGYGGSSDANLRTPDPHLDGSVDSEAPSETSTACPPPQSSSSVLVPRSSVPASPPQLRPISKPIEHGTARRAEDVIERLSGLLEEYMGKHKRQVPSMAIRIAMLGTTPDDAKACLVIFCDDIKGTHDRIRRFLRKPRAIELYCPQESMLPSFEVHVAGPPPRRCGAVKVNIPLHTTFLDSHQSTLCGMPIYFVLENSSRKRLATMGGVLQLRLPNGGEYLYGLTAAHGALDTTDSDEDGASETSDDTSSHSSMASDSQYSMPVEVNWGPWLDLLPHRTEVDRLTLPTDATVRERVVLSALANAQDGSFRDWALFSFPSDDVTPKPNMLQLEGRPPVPLKAPSSVNNMSGSRSVMVITGSSEPVKATLSPCLSRILLKPGTKFVRAYVVELHNTLGIEATATIHLGSQLTHIQIFAEATLVPGLLTPSPSKCTVISWRLIC